MSVEAPRGGRGERDVRDCVPLQKGKTLRPRAASVDSHASLGAPCVLLLASRHTDLSKSASGLSAGARPLRLLPRVGAPHAPRPDGTEVHRVSRVVAAPLAPAQTLPRPGEDAVCLALLDQAYPLRTAHHLARKHPVRFVMLVVYAAGLLFIFLMRRQD